MGMTISITSHSAEVLSALQSQKNKALEACGLTAEGYAKLLCPVDTGALRNSISHTVDGYTCYIGTNMEYAAYVELGTGKYYPGGRSTPWVYKDGKGKWHMTDGQRAQPYLKPAVADHANEYWNMIENVMRNG